MQKGYNDEHMHWLWQDGGSQALAVPAEVWEKESKLKKKETYLIIIIISKRTTCVKNLVVSREYCRVSNALT